MNTSVTIEAKIAKVKINTKDLVVLLQDGREVKVPLIWYSRLFHATPAQRNKFRLIGNGVGIHWPDLNEDLSASGFLAVR